MSDLSLRTTPWSSQIGYVASVGIMAGMIGSKFLTTIGMLLLLVAAIVALVQDKSWNRLWQNKTHLATASLFFLILISALLSENTTENMNRIRIALPLLVLPFSFAAIPDWTTKQYQQLLAIFCYSMTLACVGVLVNYFVHFEEMQAILKSSGAVPTPNGEHIRFSLMTNIAIFGGIWLYSSKSYRQSYWHIEKWLLLVSIFLLILSVHILSVRTGLLGFYAGVGISIMQLMLRQRRYKLGIVVLIAAMAMPYFAVQYVPSIRTKYELTRFNIKLFELGEIGEYSDTRRLLSYQMAWQVAQQSPWWGVGIGDLLDEQEKMYKASYPEQKVMYPHNQFLTMYVAAGVIGFLVFLLAILYPFWDKRQYQQYFILIFLSIMLLSFLTENTLLSSVGVAVYTFFLGLTANYLQGEHSSKRAIE